ncbi:MAG: hypothetical protein HY395_01880 [Candidatus Doudnabacteria bacterium]|nr:hypothetical protein [Candidatus Doudnabacteria bacterium]
MSQKGQIIIIAAVFMLVVVGLISSLVAYAGIQIKGHRQAVARVLALSIAEAGIEQAIWKLNSQPGYNGESGVAYNGGAFDISITNLSGSSKLIRAEAKVPNSSNPRGKRVVQATTTIDTTNIAFNYGVQIGEGGLEMTNSSRVIGNVYSNGNINGANSARIQGTATVAGSSNEIREMQVDGNANAYLVVNSTIGGSLTTYHLFDGTVGGNVVGTALSTCTIGGNAVYDTIFNCNVGGSSTAPNPDDFVAAPQLPLPITDEQIDAWEDEAEAGGVISTQSYSSGSRNLGPKKINGDLILSNTAQVVVTGTLWVTGQIRLSNSAILRLDSSYGSLSGVVLAGVDGSSSAGYIEVANSAQLLGSGTAGSYIMLLSQRVGIASNAIRMSNGSGAAILYSGEGVIEINNSAALKEVTAYKLKITNNATVTYESGLASAQFSSGPGGGWEMLDGTWQLLQ